MIKTAAGSDEQILRVAVVGPGGWGRHHTGVFAGRADTILCAVVGRDRARTDAEASRLGVAGYVDIEQMLAEQRPDLVTVSLPNEDHFRPTLRSCTTASRCWWRSRWCSIWRRRTSCWPKRPGPTRSSRSTSTTATPSPSSGPAPRSWTGVSGQPVFTTWRFGGEANKGSSPHKNIIETQCHAFDLLEHLLGPISSIAAQMTDLTYGAWSTIALSLGFASGAVGTLLGSYDSSYAYRDTQLLEINGTLGRAVVHDTVQHYSFQRVGDETATTWRPGYFNDSGRSFHHTFDAYVDDMLAALRAGKPPRVPAAAGRRALLLARRAIESHESGRRVSVEPDGYAQPV